MAGQIRQRPFLPDVLNFSGSGRLPRGRFCLALACQAAAGGALVAAALCSGESLPADAAMALCAIPVWLAGSSVARRLHDLGKSAWWLPAVVATFPVGLPLIALGEGEPGDNRWGPNPKGLLRIDDPRLLAKLARESRKGSVMDELAGGAEEKRE